MPSGRTGEAQPREAEEPIHRRGANPPDGPQASRGGEASSQTRAPLPAVEVPAQRPSVRRAPSSPSSPRAARASSRSPRPRLRIPSCITKSHRPRPPPPPAQRGRAPRRAAISPEPRKSSPRAAAAAAAAAPSPPRSVPRAPPPAAASPALRPRLERPTDDVVAPATFAPTPAPARPRRPAPARRARAPARSCGGRARARSVARSGGRRCSTRSSRGCAERCRCAAARPRVRPTLREPASKTGQVARACRCPRPRGRAAAGAPVPRRVQYDPRRSDQHRVGPPPRHAPGRAACPGVPMGRPAGRHAPWPGAARRKSARPAADVSTKEMSAHKKVIRIEENITLSDAWPRR